MCPAAASEKGVPSLGLEGELLAVGADEGGAEGGLGDVPDEVDVLQGGHLFVVGQGHGEEQLVVLAAVEGAGEGRKVELFADEGRLVIDGDALLVDTAAYAALLADVEQFGGEAVADVHHGGGADAGLGEAAYDVGPRFGLELPFEDVFLAGEVGLRRAVSAEDALLAFEYLQSGVGRAEVSAHADEVGGACAAAVDDAVGRGFAQAGDADGQPREGRGRVAAHDVHGVALAAEAHAGVERFDVFQGEAFAQGQRYGHLPWRAVHGADVREVDGHGLVAEVLEWRIGEVEMDAFHEHVGGHEQLRRAVVVEHGGVVAHGFARRGVAVFEILREFVDKSELPEGGDLRALGFLHGERGKGWNG